MDLVLMALGLHGVRTVGKMWALVGFDLHYSLFLEMDSTFVTQRTSNLHGGRRNLPS